MGDTAPMPLRNPKRATRARKSLADWRSVRVWEGDTREQLRKKHWLWLHGWCIGFLVLGAMWGVSHVGMVFGGDHSLALRYAVTLGVGYVVFLAVLRVWAGFLVQEEAGLDVGDAGDAADLAVDVGSEVAEGLARGAGRVIRSGRGGDFGGGGADAGFGEAIAEAGSSVGDALGAVGDADEGAIVVVPLLAVFAIACVVALGAGSLLLLYFGSEVLLAVALEIAFGYVSARTAVKLAREGWISAAVRLTWKPLLGALLCAVALGLLLDHFVPDANSLPEAIRMMRR